MRQLIYGPVPLLCHWAAVQEWKEQLIKPRQYPNTDIFPKMEIFFKIQVQLDKQDNG